MSWFESVRLSQARIQCLFFGSHYRLVDMPLFIFFNRGRIVIRRVVMHRVGLAHDFPPRTHRSSRSHHPGRVGITGPSMPKQLVPSMLRMVRANRSVV